MPTVYALLPDHKPQFLDSAGDPLSGGKVFVYTAGSSSKATTYTESDGVTPNSNPIVLDSRGEMPTGCYVESGTYKLVLAPASDTDPPASPIWTRDNVSPVNDTATVVSQWVSSGLTPTYVSASQFTLVGDQTTAFHVGRRVRAVGTVTTYGVITASAYSAPNTTVTVSLDSGSLDPELSAVLLGILTSIDSAIPHTVASATGLTVTLAGEPAAALQAVPLRDLHGYISGLIVSNNGTDAEHDIDISAGVAVNAGTTMAARLGSGITKRLDATFAEGTGNGGMADGESLPTSGTVHVFVVSKDSDGTIDVMADTSATGANADAGWTVQRRIASLRTDSSANLIAGTATETGGGAYMWEHATPIPEWATSLNSGARSLKTLTGVPVGIKTMWHGNVRITLGAGTVGAIVTSPDQLDVATAGAAAGAGLTLATETNGAVDGQDVSRVTNTSAQVGIRSSGSGSDWGTTYGYTDWRR